MTDAFEIIAQLKVNGASAAIDGKIADLICGRQGFRHRACG